MYFRNEYKNPPLHAIRHFVQGRVISIASLNYRKLCKKMTLNNNLILLEFEAHESDSEINIYHLDNELNPVPVTELNVKR